MKRNKLKELADKIDGYKTLIGVIGSAIIPILNIIFPEYAVIWEKLLLIFGSLGATGFLHKLKKKEIILPKGLMKIKK